MPTWWWTRTPSRWRRSGPSRCRRRRRRACWQWFTGRSTTPSTPSSAGTRRTWAACPQFRPAGPPALTSAQYATEYNEVKSLGRATGSTRTADQTQIALFWADGAGTVAPPGHWNEIAQKQAISHHLSLEETARMFALL